MGHARGFTLIELMVVMTILGILVSIAVPQYSKYRTHAYDTQAKMDLRGVAIAEEAYYVDSSAYLSCANESCHSLPGIAALSKGVTLTINSTETGFVGTSTHRKGSGKIFTWDTSKGGAAQ